MLDLGVVVRIARDGAAPGREDRGALGRRHRGAAVRTVERYAGDATAAVRVAPHVAARRRQPPARRSPAWPATTCTGDASASLLYVLRERSGWPNIILSLDGVFGTGPGDKEIGGGIVLSKSYDPACFSPASTTCTVTTSIRPIRGARSRSRTGASISLHLRAERFPRAEHRGPCHLPQQRIPRRNSHSGAARGATRCSSAPPGCSRGACSGAACAWAARARTSASR